MDFRIEQLPNYVAVRVSGSPTLEEFLQFVDRMAADSLAWPRGAVLVDLRKVVTLKSFTEQFTIGEAAGRKLAHIGKLASLVPPDRMTKTSEKVGRKVGLNLVVFTCEDDAIAWLGEAG